MIDVVQCLAMSDQDDGGRHGFEEAVWLSA